MEPSLLIAVLCLLGWLAILAVKSLWARQVGRWWRSSLVVSLVLGIALGIWLGGFFEYRPSAKLRVLGFPVPVAAFALERGADGQEQWTDFVPPFPELVVAANVLLTAIMSVYPVWAANTLARCVLTDLRGRRGEGAP